MMIDASAIVAILNREADAERYKAAISAARGRCLVSPLTIFEAAVSLARAKAVLQGRKPSGDEIRIALEAVRSFQEANSIKEIMISGDLGRAAVEASAQYGKVVGHPADLNFGDCFAYACARGYRVPLLFKGDDFTKTDIRSGLLPAE